MELFPALKYGMEWNDGVYLVKKDNEPWVTESEDTIKPYSGRIGGYGCSVTFCRNRLSVILAHTITDGRGMFEFSENLIYRYFCISHGRQYEWEGVKREVSPNEFADFWEIIDNTDIESVGDSIYEKDGIVIPENNEDGDSRLNYADISIPSKEFMEYVRGMEASPAAVAVRYMMLAAAKKNNYSSGSLSCNVTVDARKAFGMEGTFMNCSLGAAASMDIEKLYSPKECLGKLKKEIRSQAQKEELVAFAQRSIKKRAYMSCSISFMLSYFGTSGIGEADRYIERFVFYEETSPKINMYEIKDEFHLNLFFGSGTKDYAGELLEILKKDGFNCRVEYRKFKKEID